jgi:ABC-type bacteriocin/lantibiotic exporter with double-glycine peptidase domain
MQLFLVPLTLLTWHSDEIPRPGARSDCGAVALYVAMLALDDSRSDEFDKLLGELNPSEQGNSIGELAKAAEARGFQTAIVSTSLESLNSRERPFGFIAHVRDSHFVAVADTDLKSVTIVDDGHVVSVPAITFLSEWSGAGLLLAKQSLEEESSLQSRIAWWRFLRWLTIGVVSAVTIALASRIIIPRLKAAVLRVRSG